MTGAIFTLAGVIIGAGIGAWMQLLFRRREEGRDVRVAARLLVDELTWAKVTITASANRDGPIPPRDGLDAQLIEAWVEHRTTLSRELSADDWDAVAAAARAWQIYEWLFRATGPQEQADTTVARIDRAVRALIPLTI